MTTDLSPAQQGRRVLVVADAVTGRPHTVASVYAAGYAEWAGMQPGWTSAQVQTPLSDVEILAGWRLEAGALVARPALDIPPQISLAVGETRTITLPAGAVATVGADRVVVDDGQLTLSGEIAGTYAVSIEAWPAVDTRVEVTVQ